MNDFIYLRKTCVLRAARLLVLAGLAAAMIATQTNAVAQDQKSPVQTPSPATGSAENGKKIFNTVGCFECHDHEGQGGAGTGPRLAGNPITFSAFLNQLRHPASQNAPVYTESVIRCAGCGHLGIHICTFDTQAATGLFNLCYAGE